MMQIATGDEVGLVKVFSLNPRAGKISNEDTKSGAESVKPSLIWGKVDRQHSIEALAYGSHLEKDDQIWIARKGGLLSCIDRATGDLSHELSFDWKNANFSGLNVSKSRLGIANTSGRIEFLSLENLDGVDREVFQVGEKLSKMRVHKAHDNLFACGGEENDLSVYDLGSGSKNPTFKAKNVKNNFLDLRVPVWITDLQFMNATPHEIVVGTKYHHMRLYDTRSARRPVVSVEVGESPIRSLCMIPDTRQALFSDTLGNLQIFDFTARKVLAGFKGFSGAAVDIQCHPELPNLVASVSVDRFLRIHDISSRKLLQKIYLKQKQSCLQLSPEEEVPAEDDDEIWENMETEIGLDKRKSRSSHALNPKEKKRSKTNRTE